MADGTETHALTTGAPTGGPAAVDATASDGSPAPSSTPTATATAGSTGGPSTASAGGPAGAVVPVPQPPRPPASGRPNGPERRRGAETSPGPVTASRMLSRLARFGQHRQSNVSPVLEPLLRTVRTTHPKADLAVVEKAFERAERAHDGQRRKSGDPYITHPVAVATILAELGMTPSTLAAALLHDTVEDTDYTLGDLRAEFGDEIALLVDGVTKLDKVTYGEAAQSETVRKMIVAMAKDIRVLVIKLADRLHNARTWRYVSASSAEKKARETLEIYAPLAHRLGMNTIKWELEDLSFATVYPKVFDEIVRLVADRAPAREEYLQGVRAQIEDDLKSARVRATVTGRPKHYYSIYQKMIVRGRDFAEIYDLVGIRVLVDSVRDCYAVLGALHARWNPVPGRFKDYIAMPKFNMYQSLHTTVIGPEGKPVEIQIRTHNMHQRAEYGIAAHWKYKDDPTSTGGGGARQGEMDWLKSVVDWQRESATSDFLDDLRWEINASQVFVFTPKGDVLPLPAGSTPVDFAYAVHTEVGHRTMGARVNGRLVPLDSTLDNGDLVEIFTSKADGAGPSRDWLQFVKSPRARNKIKQHFSKERREEAIEDGKDEIARAMRKQHLPLQRLMSHESLLVVARELNLGDVSALYAAVGEKHVSAQHVVDKLIAAVGGEAAVEEDLAEATTPGQARPGRSSGDAGVVVSGAEDVWVKLARCCTPVPQDPIVGFVTRGAGVSVHREDCENVVRLRQEPERIVDVQWATALPSAQSRLFLVQIQVEALDRARLLSDVTRVLSDNHVNILSATVSTSRDRVALSKFSFEMAEPNHLGHVLGAVRRVDGVFDAYRVMASRQQQKP
ncbi:RelA/SpoT family protein [Kineococcus sp. T13]|uniref:RelA/SpoT family protein n=1 Tax=Kineococcus vitellinus TaxID=2696565 RepID=UPI0014123510|nr:bifunctional (p)ppGpp synthetase/guanosine-3',5'-bis(diphosphate) 3'-pyrophosphohydrolase [Kineococcus vitellinus]NAZ77048.1 RelA/SpoT family protein [Kineococcus vitellinus]